MTKQTDAQRIDRDADVIGNQGKETVSLIHPPVIVHREEDQVVHCEHCHKLHERRQCIINAVSEIL